MNNKPQPGIIVDDQLNQLFYAILRDLHKKIGCTYLSYVSENKKTHERIGFTSDPDWGDAYVAQKLIESCHVWKGASSLLNDDKNKSIIFPWELSKPKESKEVDVFLFREEKLIGNNGVSFCTQIGDAREFLAICPSINDKGFLLRVQNNFPDIKSKLNMIRNYIKQHKSISKRGV